MLRSFSVITFFALYAGVPACSDKLVDKCFVHAVQKHQQQAPRPTSDLCPTTNIMFNGGLRLL